MLGVELFGENNKKAQELKDGRNMRAETKVQDATKGHKAILQTEGLMSEKVALASPSSTRKSARFDSQVHSHSQVRLRKLRLRILPLTLTQSLMMAATLPHD